jgi:hypothetical protein
MKLRLPLSLAFASLSLSLVAHANVVGYVNDPTGNSVDFDTAVGAFSVYDFDGLGVGALNPTAYPGLTFGGSIDQVVYTAGPAQGNTFSTPLSSGEGLHPLSNVWESPGGETVDSLTVTFSAPVAGAGVFVIDNFNVLGTTTTISAYDSANNLLGSFNGPNDNFQNNNEYFMGITSSADDIAELVFSHNGAGTGDTIAVDDLEVAGGVGGAPAPDGASTLALLGGAIAMVGAVRRRFIKG